MKLLASFLGLFTFATSATHAELVIHEIHYDPDPKTEQVEFLELVHPGASALDVSRWTFTEGILFTFPDGTILEPGETVLIAESPADLTTKFPDIPATAKIFAYSASLSSSGETVALANASGQVVDSITYQSEFPWPISAGGEGDSMQLINSSIDNDLGGAWRSGAPTPGLPNVGFTNNAPPMIRQVAHSPQAPTSAEGLTVSAKITDPEGMGAVQLLYQIVTPGSYIPATLPNPYNTLLSSPDAPRQANPDFENPANWTSVTMTHQGLDIFSAQIPAQEHRTLIRYRIVAGDLQGASVQVPYPDDPSLNFACFVYDGVPDYEANGTTYSSEMLTSLPVYTMITRDEDRSYAYAYSSGLQIPKSSAARGSYNWECALVYDGIVYDHVDWRLRQNNDRYAGSGKRSMRFRMNRGHYFQARGEDGEKLAVKWRRFNTSKMSRFGGTNSYGLHETINSKLWRMVGVECPYFLPAHFRMIDGAAEAPDQYNGDFFGLTTIVQDIDGRLLDERELADGNIYKLKDGVANPLELQRNQTRTAVSDGSDFTNVRNNLNSSQSDAWLEQHVDWEQWARYHAVVEAVRHYDFGTPSTHFKNRAWFFQESPGSPLGKLRLIPHDHDASWIKGYHDSLNNVGNSIGTGFPWAAIFNGNTRPPTSEKTSFARDYRNVIREFRQLLWQEESVHSLLDDHVAMLEPFTRADRARWTGGPAAAGRESMVEISALVTPMKNLAFLSDTVYGSNLAGGRGAFLDQIAADSDIPAQPVITNSGDDDFQAGALQFTSSAFADPQGAGTFAAMEWRLADVTGLSGGNEDPVALAASGDLWKYFDLGTDPGPLWAQSGYDDSAWGEGPSELGYGESDEMTSVTRGNATTYFRRTLTIPDPALYRAFSAGVVRDDGAIVYVNGQEVWRNQMPEGPVDFTTLANASASGTNESEFQTFDIPPGLIVPGENIIAVEVHQTSANSGDMSFDFQLSAIPVIPERSYEWTESWTSGELAAFEPSITPPAFATRSGRSYRARVRHADTTGNWSLWSEPLEFIASSPDLSVYQNSLVVSEIMYHPAPPSAPEIALGFDDDDYFEFIEIQNVGAEVLDLTNVRFTKGIDFDFSGTLAPGERALVVHNIAAFEMRYGSGLPVVGVWTSKLDNGGERLKLSYGAGESISDFVYDDLSPWPTSPDGEGTSLTRLLQNGPNDPGLASSWRASLASGGSPGGSDLLLFTGDPEADQDNDGLNALLEFALGSTDETPDQLKDLFAIQLLEGRPVLRIQQNLAAGGLSLIIERSSDLTSWTAVSGNELPGALPPARSEDGIARFTHDLAGFGGPQFWRLRISLLSQN